MRWLVVLLRWLVVLLRWSSIPILMTTMLLLITTTILRTVLLWLLLIGATTPTIVALLGTAIFGTASIFLLWILNILLLVKILCGKPLSIRIIVSIRVW